MVLKFRHIGIKGFLLLCGFFITQCIQAQIVQFDQVFPTDGYKAGFFIEGKDTLRFRYFIPPHLNQQKLGVILFLHGSGERGNDNQKQLVHGSEFLKKVAQNDTHPCMVIFPQCPETSYWSNVKRKENKDGKPIFKFRDNKRSTKAMKLLVNFTDWLYNCQYYNNQHFVVGGLSMGGMGSIELVRRRPNVFCAAFSICGGGKIKHPEALVNTRFWFFHGEKDDIVPSVNSEDLFMQFIGAKINTRITLYADANHNSWDSAFVEPDLPKWICTEKPITIKEIEGQKP